MSTTPLNDLARHNASCRDELASAARTVLDSGWYVLGENVVGFEREFAAYCGADHAIGVGNGTDALELALRALEVEAGQSVVTVANAGMYSTAAIRAVGAEPMYVDVDADTMCIDVDRLEAVLARSPAAIVVTHLYGRLADIGRVIELAARRRIPVIEDCAQAHGALDDGTRAGAFGAIGCFSFYPTKNLGALGDGGALVTSNDLLADRLRRLRQYGWKSKYAADISGGRNSRLDELQAAFLRVKLHHLDRWNALRRSIANRYAAEIVNPRITLAPVVGLESVAHLFVVRTEDREGLATHLRNAGIATDVHYPIPDHRQVCFAGKYAELSLPHTERACDEVLTLPCFPEMTDAETQRVIDACNTWRP